MYRSRCDNLDSLRVYLRFQLPPLELAREECIHLELRSLLGVAARQARSILNDLDMRSQSLLANQQSCSILLAVLGGAHHCPKQFASFFTEQPCNMHTTRSVHRCKHILEVFDNQ